MPTLILSFAPQTREAAAAVTAPRKNLRVFGSVTIVTPLRGDSITRLVRLERFQIRTQRVSGPNLGRNGDFPSGVAHYQRLAAPRQDGRFHQFAALPLHRDFKAAACEQAAHLAIGQRGGRSEEHTSELQSLRHLV